MFLKKMQFTAVSAATVAPLFSLYSGCFHEYFILQQFVLR